MAHRSLLQYIFRQQPRRKGHNSTTPPASTKHHHQQRTSTPSLLAQKTIIFKAAPAPPPRQHAKTLPKSLEPSFTTLEDIAEEDITNDDYDNNRHSDDSTLTTSTMTFTPSLSDTLAALNIDIETFNTRELVNAMLSEAQNAVTAHLDTLEDTIAMLRALAGSCGAVGVWEREMRERKKLWEERKGVLEEAVKGVGEMLFSEEVDGRTGIAE